MFYEPRHSFISPINHLYQSALRRGFTISSARSRTLFRELTEWVSQQFFSRLFALHHMLADNRLFCVNTLRRSLEFYIN